MRPSAAVRRLAAPGPAGRRAPLIARLSVHVTPPPLPPPVQGAGGTGGAPAAASAAKKLTPPDLQEKRDRGERITMLTAYDFTTARLADAAGVDAILVGDSLGMVVLGYDSTVPVTLDDMVHHAKAVARGAQRPVLVGDLPFGSYLTPDDALRSATRLLKEARMDCVKLEGGRRVAPQISALQRQGVAVMGHIGLTPQTASALGGMRVQARTADAARALLDDALALRDAGCFSIVLECVPSPVAALITERLSIPTIGIGAGVSCSGQVQVMHDTLGLFPGFKPKFVKPYANLYEAGVAALSSFVADVRSGAFPTKEHSYAMKDEEKKKLLLETAQRTQAGPLDQALALLGGPSRPSVAAPRKSLPLAGSVARLVLAPRLRGSQFAGSLTSPLIRSFMLQQQPTRRGLANVACVGGGALGSLLAGRIASSGAHRVALVTDSPGHAAAISRQGGLRVSMVDEAPDATLLARLSLARHGEPLPLEGAADVVFLSPKGLDATRRFATEAAVLGKASAPLVSLQNGLGHFDLLRECAGTHPVVVGTTSVGARLREPGTVAQSGWGDVTLVDAPGEARGAAALPAQLLREAGFTVTIVPASERERTLWRKVAASAVINPITALLRVENGALLAPEGSAVAQLVASVARDVAAVARAAGQSDLDAEAIVHLVRRVATQSAANQSSMLQDILRGRGTEIEDIVGPMLRVADERGLDVPSLRTVYLAVKAAAAISLP
jgi:3-methyl-2-oxobutanoate hydroxymethyltransferase